MDINYERQFDAWVARRGHETDEYPEWVTGLLSRAFLAGARVAIAPPVLVEPAPVSDQATDHVDQQDGRPTDGDAEQQTITQTDSESPGASGAEAQATGEGRGDQIPAASPL